jgi:hypothetical protein
MSAVCPKCGVAVVPGYVKCPKCQSMLPQKRATTVSAGGTSSASSGGMSPAMILLAVAVLGGGIAVFALRGGSDKPALAETPPPAVAPESPVERPVAEPDDVPTPTAAQAVANDPTIAVRDLDRALKKERLWGTVEVVGSGVDVRSGSCREATMMPVVDAAIPALREAGVTKVRCLEQAGAVVFEREL